MKKKSNKSSMDAVHGIDAVSLLSEMLATEIDKSIIDGIFEMNEKDNIKTIETNFPGQAIQSVCERLGVKELKKEYQLSAKIRDWKINKLIN